MNEIILLILLNILVYYLIKKNVYLLITLFIFMIYYLLKMNKIIKNVEGNSEYYEFNFWNSLNKKVKTDREEENLFGKIIRKLNMFLKKYIYYQELPKEQPCVGKFNAWSKCSKSCGRGEQYRTFNIIQKAGKGGINCIFENGDIDKKDCFNKKCEYFKDCEEDLECNTNFCDPLTKKCGIEYQCTKNALHNCDYEECVNLGDYYHYNVKNGCDYYDLKKMVR